VVGCLSSEQCFDGASEKQAEFSNKYNKYTIGLKNRHLGSYNIHFLIIKIHARVVVIIHFVAY